MIIEPQLVTILRKKFRIGEGSSGRTLRHYPQLSAYATTGIGDVRTVFNLSTVAVMQKWFSSKVVVVDLPLPARGILLKSLNGVTVIDCADQKVIKIINQRLEPLFLENEVRAHALLPTNTPRIVESGSCEGYSYVVTQLESKKKVVYWSEWACLLPHVFAVIAGAQKTLQPVEAHAYVARIKEQLKEVGLTLTFLRSEFNQCADLLNRCLQTYTGSGRAYQVFSHGDLVPNNVIVTSKNILLCDWANGGVLNSTYDLMMQDFYSPHRLTWKNFAKIDFSLDERAELFFGSGPRFFNMQQSTAKIEPFTNQEIRQGLVLALCELTIKNALRYQSEGEWQDGRGMLENVQIICQHILNAA